MSTFDELPPAAELMRRVNVARSILAERPLIPRTRELALLVLDGATADDLLDVICRACRDMPSPGRQCAECGLHGAAGGAA